MSDDTSRQFASGRTGVLGGSRLFHQLTDDRDRARPVPSLARLAWLERPDPDSARGDSVPSLHPLQLPPVKRLHRKDVG